MLRSKVTKGELWEAEVRLVEKKNLDDKRERYFSYSDQFYSPFGKCKSRGFVGEIEVHIDEYKLSDYLKHKSLQPNIIITIRRGTRNPEWFYITSTLESFEQTFLFRGMSDEDKIKLRYAYFKQKDDIEVVMKKLRNALNNNIL